MLQKEKRPKFGIVLFIILLSVVYIFITRLSLAGTFYSLYMSGNDSNLLIVFYVQIMPDDFVMQLHRF